MARKIKFRAWHKLEGEMYYSHGGGYAQLIVGDDERTYWYPIMFDMADVPDRWEDGWDGEQGTYPISKSVMELMQYTGQKDEHGKEIFDGDLVLINGRDFNNKYFEHFCEVYWGSYGDGEYVDNIECWMVREHPVREPYTFNAPLSDIVSAKMYHVHVNANKYGNPELVE